MAPKSLPVVLFGYNCEPHLLLIRRLRAHEMDSIRFHVESPDGVEIERYPLHLCGHPKYDATTTIKGQLQLDVQKDTSACYRT